MFEGSGGLLPAEDGLEDTIRPRLEAADADLSTVTALKGYPGPGDVLWLDETDTDIAAALAPDLVDDDDSPHEADEFLQNRLADGPVERSELMAEVDEHEISASALKRAKKRLRAVRCFKLRKRFGRFFTSYGETAFPQFIKLETSNNPGDPHLPREIDLPRSRMFC